MEKSQRNIKLTIAYDGTNYHGFQRQTNAVTIQQILEEKLGKLFGHQIKVAGAGRTDAGVHAYGQVVNFYTTGSIPVEKIPLAARGIMPPDIVVLKAELAEPRFHARISAKGKTYIYRLYYDKLSNPFHRYYAWHVYHPIDVEAMHQAAQIVVGTHDFSAFRAAGGVAKNPVRTILEASCLSKNGIVEFSFTGTGFLYHMVRNLVGTLVNVGAGKICAQRFAEILASCDRHQAGATAPPQGLYLKDVYY